MKDHNLPYFQVLTLALLLACSPQLVAEIYKTIDEHGNVVYTDQPPSQDAKPLDLPGLSIISPQKPEPPPNIPGSVRASTGPEPEAQQEVTSIRELRRGYRDFAIVSPTQDQTIWGTGNEAAIAWNTRYQLQKGMSVTVYIDGAAQPSTTNTAISLGQLDRGSHEVYAVLTDSGNRRIASAARVTFHIKQYSVNFPNRQSGGG